MKKENKHLANSIIESIEQLENRSNIDVNVKIGHYSDIDFNYAYGKNLSNEFENSFKTANKVAALIINDAIIKEVKRLNYILLEL
jgi:hypothetical protein